MTIEVIVGIVGLGLTIILAMRKVERMKIQEMESMRLSIKECTDSIRSLTKSADEFNGKTEEILEKIGSIKEAMAKIETRQEYLEKSHLNHRQGLKDIMSRLMGRGEKEE